MTTTTSCSFPSSGFVPVLLRCTWNWVTKKYEKNCSDTDMTHSWTTSALPFNLFCRFLYLHIVCSKCNKSVTTSERKNLIDYFLHSLSRLEFTRISFASMLAERLVLRFSYSLLQHLSSSKTSQDTQLQVPRTGTRCQGKGCQATTDQLQF